MGRSWSQSQPIRRRNKGNSVEPTDKNKTSPHGAVTPHSAKAPVPDALPAEAVAAESAADADASRAKTAIPESGNHSQEKADKAVGQGKPRIQDPAKPVDPLKDAAPILTGAPKSADASKAAEPSKPQDSPPKEQGPLKAQDAPKGDSAATTPPKSTTGSATPPPPPPRERAPSGSGSGSGKGLSALALLVALAALGLSGWQWYQSQEGSDAQDGAVQARFEELSAAQQQSVQQAVEQSRQLIDERLEDVPQAGDVEQVRRMTADLQRSQQATSQQLEALQGEARSDWKLAEAEYLLRLASLRLLAAQDVRSAKELLNAVDQILRDEPDSGVFPVREQLAQYRAELDGLPEVDRPGIYLRLAALSEQVNRIVALPVAVFDPEEMSVEEEYEDRLERRTRLERVLMRLERYVRVDFQRGKVITPQLDEAEMQRIRRTLQLSIEQGQWAALRGEQEVYRKSLEQAEGVLRQFFELENPQVSALQNQLRELAEREVALSPPDLSPLQQGLAAYIQSRRSNGVNGGNASSDGGNGQGNDAETGDQEAGNE